MSIEHYFMLGGQRIQFSPLGEHHPVADATPTEAQVVPETVPPPAEAVKEAWQPHSSLPNNASAGTNPIIEGWWRDAKPSTLTVDTLAWSNLPSDGAAVAHYVVNALSVTAALSLINHLREAITQRLIPDEGYMWEDSPDQTASVLVTQDKILADRNGLPERVQPAWPAADPIHPPTWVRGAVIQDADSGHYHCMISGADESDWQGDWVDFNRAKVAVADAVRSLQPKAFSLLPGQHPLS